MKSDPRDYKLDIRSADVRPPTLSDVSHEGGRSFLSVWFACCSTYLRVYLSRDGTRYAARCPKCGGTITFRVGPGGTERRTFVVE
jgi:hypothetical protein